MSVTDKARGREAWCRAKWGVRAEVVGTRVWTAEMKQGQQKPTGRIGEQRIGPQKCRRVTTRMRRW